MTAEHMQLYRQKLLDTKSYLIGKIQEDEERIQNQSAFGEAIEYLKGYFLHCANLRLVEGALERIEQQTYGKCHHCGGGIKRKRLAVAPWARFCLMCQGLGEEPDCFLSEVARRTYRAVDCGATEI